MKLSYRCNSRTHFISEKYNVSRVNRSRDLSYYIPLPYQLSKRRYELAQLTEGGYEFKNTIVPITLCRESYPLHRFKKSCYSLDEACHVIQIVNNRDLFCIDRQNRWFYINLSRIPFIWYRLKATTNGSNFTSSYPKVLHFIERNIACD